MNVTLEHNSNSTQHKRAVSLRNPIQRIRERLAATPQVRDLVPGKYERYGHVLIVPWKCQDAFPCTLGSALAHELHVDCILQAAPSAGDLRVPLNSRILWISPEVISKSPAVTHHEEDGICYAFDASKIMFSSGNIKERTRFGRDVRAAAERVLDMFAGIGYFSLPLAAGRSRSGTRSKPEKPELLVAIEKNPDSFQYLKQNFEKYRKRACAHILLLGDNRRVGDEYRHTFHRILMGFLPDTRRFLSRALEFANESSGSSTPRCVIHYHFLSHANRSPQDTLDDEFSPHTSGAHSIMQIRKIKSFSPLLYHMVADVALL